MKAEKHQGKKKLTSLFGKYGSASRYEKEDIIFAIIDTGLPDAAEYLVKIAESEGDGQLRSFAINGFLKIHPKAIRDDLIRLAESKSLEEDEFADMQRSVLIRAIGLMNDRSSLDALRQLERRMRSVKSLYYYDSLEFNFLATYARLGDKDAARRLVGKVLMLGQQELIDALRKLVYCESLTVAERLAELLDDDRRGSRTHPYRDYRGPPSSDEEAKRRLMIDEDAYVRVKDDALHAITQMLGRRGWGFDPEPLRRYSEEEFGLARRKLESLVRGVGKITHA